MAVDEQQPAVGELFETMDAEPEDGAAALEEGAEAAADGAEAVAAAGAGSAPDIDEQGLAPPPPRPAGSIARSQGRACGRRPRRQDHILRKQVHLCWNLLERRPMADVLFLEALRVAGEPVRAGH